MPSTADRVRQVIRAVHETQAQFAGSIGLDPPQLSRSLRGTRRFRVEELEAVARRAGVTVDWLVQGRGEPPRSRPDDGDRLHGGGRRAAMLEATFRLIAGRGYHAVRVVDIARLCGTSTAAVLYYFPTKEDLLQEALRYAVSQAFDRQGAALRRIDDAHERMLCLIDLQLPVDRVRSEWLVWLQVWSETSLNRPMRLVHNEFYERWQDTAERIIRRGCQQKVFREVDPADLALRFTALVDGLGIQVLTGAPGVTTERMRQVLLDFVQRDLLA